MVVGFHIQKFLDIFITSRELFTIWSLFPDKLHIVYGCEIFYRLNLLVVWDALPLSSRRSKILSLNFMMILIELFHLWINIKIAFLTVIEIWLLNDFVIDNFIDKILQERFSKRVIFIFLQNCLRLFHILVCTLRFRLNFSILFTTSRWRPEAKIILVLYDFWFFNFLDGLKFLKFQLI